MGRPLFAAGLCLALLCHRGEFAMAQLASQSKAPEELLLDYLLYADEISSSFCSRIKGTVSVVDNSGRRPPFVKSVFGITAVQGPKISYHCWGEQSLTSNLVNMKPIGWREQIWDGKKQYRKMSGGNTGGTAREIEEETEDFKPVLSSMTLLDPMGMAISASVETHGDRSNLTKKKQFFLAATLRQSSSLENGDIIGCWLAPNEYSLATIRFGHDVNFMPVRIEYHLWNKEEEKPGRRFSEVLTVWKNPRENASHFLPVSMSMLGYQGEAQVIETEFESIEWVAPERWEAAKLDFHSIAIAPNSVWRNRFLFFFEAEK